MEGYSWIFIRPSLPINNDYIRIISYGQTMRDPPGSCQSRRNEYRGFHIDVFRDNVKLHRAIIAYVQP